MNRYLSTQAEKERQAKGQVQRKRPKLASECDDLAAADKYYHQITREVGQKVMDIQNAGLGEARIRYVHSSKNTSPFQKTRIRLTKAGG